ncbi:MAG: tetratricopeptide repeat protein [Vicinamibacterales bacterium]
MTSDPQPSASPALESEHDREARLEELLLSGLDYYFAGQHELAINVWTRALFIDRGHARARAYIERARSAIAERQREGEELIHSGAAAFQRGDPDTARALLRTAVERGAATEEALAMLERLDRLEAASVPDSRIQRLDPPRTATADVAATRSFRSWLGWVAAGVVLGFATAVVIISVLWSRGEPWLAFDSAPSAESSTRVHEEPLPVPAASDVAFARAQSQFERGHLREALLALDAIGPGDPLSAEADRLKGTIQSKLLEAARTPPPDTKVGTPAHR